MSRDALCEDQAPWLVVATVFDQLAAPPPAETIRLESCSPLDWIVVKTRQNVYDIIVLSGESGEVLVRGGGFFPEFRRARIGGSIFGGSAVMLKSICVGLYLELHVGRKSIVTSRIQSLSTA